MYRHRNKTAHPPLIPTLSFGGADRSFIIASPNIQASHKTLSAWHQSSPSFVHHHTCSVKIALGRRNWLARPIGTARSTCPIPTEDFS
mmetsp:Transcript_658/g.1512  ORF Transcript_658/g.1512 Transcript_658/m.1512 type:complete len:88 (-) Transcript_658:18-281(-)